jgi:anionic cell wall polymer biosynthesis LytR-Cps2A-Psr (LCP) family protein
MSDIETLPPRVEPGARRDRRRRRSLRRRLAGVATVGIPLIVILAVVISQVGGDAPSSVPRTLGNAAEGDQVTYLLVGTRANDPSSQADWLTLLAINRNGTKPLTLFIPTATLTEIPGYGYDSVGKAMALGRVPLQEISVENLLGVQIDHTLMVPESLMSRLVDRAGGVEVTVRGSLLEPQGSNRLVPIFQPGRQRFDGAKAVKFLGYVGQDEDELARFGRAQQLWEALYGRFPGDKVDDLSTIVSGFGSALVTDAPPGDVGVFFSAFAAAGEAREYRTLPVDTIGSGGDEDAFRVRDADLEALVSGILAASRPADSVGRGTRVQILNGNGEPEIGVQVASLLVPDGFRIAVTGNAQRFDYRKTRIVFYRDADLALAQRIRRLIGVGQIEKGRTQQTIVDITIVVGQDFLSRNQ